MFGTKGKLLIIDAYLFVFVHILFQIRNKSNLRDYYNNIKINNKKYNT